MGKKRLEIIITSVLVIIFVFALVNGLKVVKQKISPAVVSTQTPVLVSKKAVSKENLSWGRCPFSGKIYTPFEGKKEMIFKLEGIIWDQSNPQALINNKVIQVGDTLDNYSVIKIEKSKVLLNDGNKDLELSLRQD